MKNEGVANGGEYAFSGLSPEDFRQYMDGRLVEKREFVASSPGADEAAANIMLVLHPQGQECTSHSLEEEPLVSALTLAESLSRQTPGMSVEEFLKGLQAGAPFSGMLAFFDSPAGAAYGAVFSETVTRLFGNKVETNPEAEMEIGAEKQTLKLTPERRVKSRRVAAGVLSVLIVGSTISHFWPSSQHGIAVTPLTTAETQLPTHERLAHETVPTVPAASVPEMAASTNQVEISPLESMHCVNGEQIVRGVRLFSLAKKCGVTVETIVDHSGLLGSLPGDVITGTPLYYTSDAPTAEQARVERAAAEAASSAAIQACTMSGTLATPAQGETNYALVKRTFPNASSQQITEIAGSLGEHLPHQVVCIKTTPPAQATTASQPVKSIEG